MGLYNNRFEVISPGALNNSMSVEKMMAGQRSPRNMIIMEVLRDYGCVDFRGMGIRTKIILLTRALSGQVPEFTATDDYLKTVLYRSPSL
ncbi:ATP-binding protein [Salmonella enterica subsp. enterica]|uniref:ATP-binding protein n=1 Tax=Salmonella enterica TaxID=28901 RepID=UPI0023044BBC|nr:ATP-binding protein [Citrobacter sp. Igbk 14]